MISSIKINIGMPSNSYVVRDVRAIGIAEMMSVVHMDYESLLTGNMLFLEDWGEKLFILWLLPPPQSQRK
ncbi:MAG: hypothetical protein COA49_05990 [Bacteroidetes bacterium]|nr:MAG: hypothetical protein COA49_05990 [Bacteroidota bacterium]